MLTAMLLLMVLAEVKYLTSVHGLRQSESTLHMLKIEQYPRQPD